jgi:acylphosphatase
MTEIATRAIIRGRVQGVGFRAWTVSAARARGLSGWVRNRPDGTVEMLAAGPEAEVSALLAEVADGPPSARVSDVETTPESPPARSPDGALAEDFAQV